jgi:Zn-dependent protease
MKKRINTVFAVILKSTKLFKIFKSAKALKVFFSLMSMAIFVVCHSAVMGLAFGIALFVLLFIHELGHIIALKQKGFETKIPFFIPFLGAVIFSPRFNDKHTEAYVGFGGPFIGTLAATACMIPYFMTGDHFWVLISFVGIALNLFNMIPLSPLDGGRITQAVHPGMKYIGIGLLLFMTLLFREPGMLIVWMACIMDIDKIRMKKRMIMTCGIWVLMASLTLVGVGNNAIANWIDTGVGIFLFLPAVFMLLGGDYSEREQRLAEMEEEQRDKRPTCATKQRIGWFVAWIVLIVVQVGIVMLQFPLLPHQK